MKRLEYHILGNHLFANAKALIHAGLYFDGSEADDWYARGFRIIEQQLPAQVLADGGHFELSPMYHAIVLEDQLDLVNLLGAYGRTPPPGWLTAIERMQRWLHVMTHPDGEIAFFNDAAFGIAPRSADLKAYATRLRTPAADSRDGGLVVLEQSGYVRAIRGAAYLICDCALVGPDYLPAHGHADTLSFELSLFGRRLFVNSGNSQYGGDAERQRQRGTAAHCTVVVDGCDSTQVWAGFRVARRASARLHAAVVSNDSVIIEASHDGYRRLRGHNEHRRRWVLSERALTIEDQITGVFASAEGFFHLHPDVQVTVEDPQRIALRSGDGLEVHMSFEGSAKVNVRPGTWHPKFGTSVANHCLVARFGPVGALKTVVSWASSS